MPPDLTTNLTTPILTQGVLGVAVVALALVVIKLWGELKAEGAAQKVEIAAKDALIK